MNLSNKYKYLTDDGLAILPPISSYKVRVCKIHIHDKIYAGENTKEANLQLAHELNKFGYITRVGRNCEIELWSVAINGFNSNRIGYEESEVK